MTSVPSERASASNSFVNLDLSPDVCERLAQRGYVEPTPIQAAAIPLVLDGADVLACAQTGTGKTAAFALPILELIQDEGEDRDRSYIRALVLAPTRELAAQIGDSFAAYGGKHGPKSLVVFGGVPRNSQVRALRQNIEVLVATPGRLIDLLSTREVDLSRVDCFVLDEADRMLDMGFVRDVRKIDERIPEARQCLLFSATMPTEVRKLANALLYEPEYIEVDPVSSTCEPIRQTVYHVDKGDKGGLLVELLADSEIERALVFTRTKHGANKLTRVLEAAGIGAAAIHGNKSQGARVRALSDFKASRIRVVVATDIAARGIDIKELDFVFNFDLPNEPESYVHRVGRTGRAGSVGSAISFCSPDERSFLRDIERLTHRTLERVATPDFAPAPKPAQPERGNRPNRSGDRSGRSGRPGRSPQGRGSSRGGRSASSRGSSRSAL